MQRLLPLLLRSSPQIARKIVIPSFCLLHTLYLGHFTAPKCYPNEERTLSETITAIENNVIKVQANGDLVGEAFCFAQNYMVAVSYDLQEIDNKHLKKNYQFFLGEKRLEGKVTVIGQFENLTFFEYASSGKMTPLPAPEPHESQRIFPVQIFKMGQYAHIKNGYYVAKDSGYGIVDGKGEIGSLVITNGKAAGIVTQIGRNMESGFIRMIEWKDLPKILEYVRGKKQKQLGISAQARQFKEGISVVRIAPNSLLKDHMMMGDTILRANGQKVREAEALQRIFILSDSELTLSILRDESPMEIKIKL